MGHTARVRLADIGIFQICSVHAASISSQPQSCKQIADAALCFREDAANPPAAAAAPTAEPAVQPVSKPAGKKAAKAEAGIQLLPVLVLTSPLQTCSISAGILRAHGFGP